MKRPVKVLAALGALALVAAACGGGEEVEQKGPVLIGADGLLSDTYVTIPETKGMYFSGPALSDVAGYKAFVGKYEAKAGKAPIQAFHAHAFDAANLLLSAIETVAKKAADGTVTVARQDLIDALYATKDFKGLTGNLTCNKFGDCAQPAISVYRNTDPTKSIGGVFANVVYTSRPEGAATKTGADPGGKKTTAKVTIKPGDPIKIATLQAITGPPASLGLDQVTAVEVAIDDRAGKLLDHPISLQKEDDLCSAEGGQSGAEKIVADPQVIGVVGTSCSGAQRAAMPLFARRGIAVVSGSNTSPGLTATGYIGTGDLKKGGNWQYGYFRTAHNDEFQGQGSAEFVFKSLGLKTAATIHDGDPYTQGLVDQFKTFFEGFGGTVVKASAINPQDTDMRPVLTEIKSANPDVIYFPIFQPAGDFVVKQAREVFAA